MQIIKNSKIVKICKDKQIILETKMNENKMCYVKCDTELCKMNKARCAYTSGKKSDFSNFHDGIGKNVKLEKGADIHVNNKNKKKKSSKNNSNAEKCEHKFKNKMSDNQCSYAYIYFGESYEQEDEHKENFEKVQDDESEKYEMKQEDEIEEFNNKQKFSSQDSDQEGVKQVEIEFDENKSEDENKDNKNDQIVNCEQDDFYDAKESPEMKSRENSTRPRKQPEHVGENIYEKKMCKMKDKQRQ